MEKLKRPACRDVVEEGTIVVVEGVYVGRSRVVKSLWGKDCCLLEVEGRRLGAVGSVIYIVFPPVLYAAKGV